MKTGKELAEAPTLALSRMDAEEQNALQKLPEGERRALQENLAVVESLAEMAIEDLQIPEPPRAALARAVEEFEAQAPRSLFRAFARFVLAPGFAVAVLLFGLYLRRTPNHLRWTATQIGDELIDLEQGYAEIAWDFESSLGEPEGEDRPWGQTPGFERRGGFAGPEVRSEDPSASEAPYFMQELDEIEEELDSLFADDEFFGG